MFGSKVTILSLSQKQVGASVVALGKTPKVQQLASSPWTPETLGETLKQLASQLPGRTIRVLLAEDIAYVVELHLPKQEALNREQVLSQLKIQIPEELHDHDWDFRLEPASKAAQADGQKILAFAPVQQLWQLFSTAVMQACLEVEAVEPEQIARKRHPDPVIALALKTDLKGKDEQVLNLKTLPAEPDTAPLPQAQDQPTTDQLQKREETPVSPKLEMPLPKPALLLQHQVPPTPLSKPGSKKPYVLLAGGVALLVALIGGGLVISQRAFAPQPSPTPLPTAIPSPTPEPTPEATQSAVLKPEDLQDYSVQILNGSGVAGEAGKVLTLLETEGFTTIATGNAENFDYEKTEVHLAQGVDDQLFEVVERALGDQFTVTRYPTPMTDQAEYDIVIIVGTRK